MANRLETRSGDQVHSIVNVVKSDAPKEEIPSRIQGSVGIGVLGLGERHTNGAREARKAQQF